MTQKLSPGLSIREAPDDVRALLVWNPIVIDRHVLEGAWSVEDRFGFSWWDSLIVAAAQIGDCGVLLTEDLQHDQTVDGLKIVNPFMAGEIS